MVTPAANCAIIGIINGKTIETPARTLREHVAALEAAAKLINTHLADELGWTSSAYPASGRVRKHATPKRPPTNHRTYTITAGRRHFRPPAVARHYEGIDHD